MTADINILESGTGEQVANADILETVENLQKYYEYLVTHLLNKLKTVNLHFESENHATTAKLVCDHFVAMGACTTDYDPVNNFL